MIFPVSPTPGTSRTIITLININPRLSIGGFECDSRVQICRQSFGTSQQQSIAPATKWSLELFVWTLKNDRVVLVLERYYAMKCNDIIFVCIIAVSYLAS